MEELCAGCAGIANIFGAHYLGLAGVILSFDVHHWDRFLHETVEAERSGEAVLLSAAVTEPMAGTDVEDDEFIPGARLVTAARRTAGGYVLNGTKVFISNGSVAAYNVVICPLDRKRPLETWSAFVVPAGSEGFSAEKVELKMGQRACHAAELVFTDCFVPEENMLGTEGGGAALTGLVLAASRPPVAAIATGIARGAYETCLAFCRRKKHGAGRLIDRQWVQMALADMQAMVNASRCAYLHAAHVFDTLVTTPAFGRRVLVEPLLRFTSPLRRTAPGRRITASRRWKESLAAHLRTAVPEASRDASLGISSLAKFSAGDNAVRVCLKAMEILGQEGAEERAGVEKRLRDAKLTQIYEGTNQLNRYEAFKRLTGRG